MRPHYSNPYNLKPAFDFNDWRAQYDTMSYQDHVLCYSKLWDLYPDQEHFDQDALLEFISTIHIEGGIHSVLEIGGWTGELASEILARNTDIFRWDNVEICREAAFASMEVCTDPRYAPLLFNDFVWNRLTSPNYDMLVMSHCAEHMRWEQLKKIFDLVVRPAKFNGLAVFLATPLASGPTDWTDYKGTHILEVGWDEITHYLFELGLELTFESGESRGYTWELLNM